MLCKVTVVAHLVELEYQDTDRTIEFALQDQCKFSSMVSVASGSGSVVSGSISVPPVQYPFTYQALRDDRVQIRLKQYVQELQEKLQQRFVPHLGHILGVDSCGSSQVRQQWLKELDQIDAKVRWIRYISTMAIT